MTHRLEKKVQAVGRQARWWMLVNGVALCLAICLGLAIVLGLADFCLRYQNATPRVLAFSALVTVVIWCVWRFVYPTLRQRWDAVGVARRIEQRFPQLRDSLSSSIAFLGDSPSGEPMGSPALRAAVVDETSRTIDQMNLGDCIDSSSARRVAGIALLITAALAAVVLIDGNSTWVAARRLFTPWIDEPWPQWNHLQWVDPPERLAQGTDFEIELVDTRGRLPEEVTIEYRLEDDSRTWTKLMERQDNRMVTRLERVTEAFHFRAFGGDDTLPWRSVQVVQPARLRSPKAMVTPPAYTGRPPYQTQGDVQAIAGSTLIFEATVTKPIADAELKSDLSVQPTVRLSDNGRRMTLPAEPSDDPWRLEQSGEFSFVLTDQEGAEAPSARRFQLQVVPDEPPSIGMELPDPDAAFAVNAVVPIRVMVKDDIAIHRVTLHFLGQVAELYTQPTPTRPTETEVSGDARVIEYDWDLTPLGLSPGDVVEFHVEAADFLPQTAESPVRRLMLLTDAELQQRLARINDDIREKIEEARRAQVAVRDQSRSTLSRLEEQQSVDRRDIDALQSAEIHQRQVARALGEADGAAGLAETLLESIKQNRLDDAELARRASALLEELGRIQQETLPPLQSRLSDANKTARAADETNATRSRADLENLRSNLRSVTAEQEQVLGALDQLLGKLSQWDSLDHFMREADELLADQDGLLAETGELETFAKEWSELTDTERARLRQLAQRQNRLADRLDRLVSGMRDVRQEARGGDPKLASDLNRALDASGDQTAAEARQAARELEENRIGQATTSQQQARGGLQRMLDTFPRKATARDEAFNEIVNLLAERQRQVLRDTVRLDEQNSSRNARSRREFSAAAGRVADAQRRIAAATTDAERRFTAEKPVLSQALRNAEASMSQAASRLGEGDTGSRTSELERAALDRLVQLSEALDKRRPGSPKEPPPAESSREQNRATRMTDPAEIEMLRLWQADLQSRTRQLDQNRSAAGTPIDESDAVAGLADEQQQLADTAGAALGKPLPPNGPRDGGPTQSNAASATGDLDQALRDAAIPGFAGELPAPMPAANAAPRPGELPAPRPESESNANEEDTTQTENAPLDRAYEGMQSAADRLRDSDTSNSTQRLQQEAIDELTTLMSGQSPQPASSGSQTTASSSENQTTGQAGDAQDGDPRANSELGSAETVRTGDDPSAGSWRRVWGQLPERIREQILNPEHEEFLPGYETLIENYYRRLAEQEDKP